MLQLQTIVCQDSTTLPGKFSFDALVTFYSFIFPLVDSIPLSIEGNCAEQFALDNTICCVMIEQEPTRFFCTVQCSGSGICICVNRTTGEALDGVPSFPETDRNFYDCLTVLPTEPPTTSMLTTEVPPDGPGTSNNPNTTNAPIPEPPEPAATEETEVKVTDEEPTDDLCEESSSTKDSSSSSSRSSSRSSKRGSSSSKSVCSGSSSSSRSSSSRSKSSKSSSGSTSRSRSSSRSGSYSASTSGSSSSSSSSKLVNLLNVHCDIIRDVFAMHRSQ